MTTDRSDDTLPYAVALFALGLGTFAITFLSLPEPNVSYSRTQGTALLAMGLTTVAICLQAWGKFDRPWWRAFWTAGFIAYALHFWWAIYRTYDGQFDAVFERQGLLVASANFVTTAIWAIHVAVIWLGKSVRKFIPQLVHRFVWLVVTVSFGVAAGSKTWWLGALFGALVVLILLLRISAYFKQLLAVDARLEDRDAGPRPPKPRRVRRQLSQQAEILMGFLKGGRPRPHSKVPVSKP